MVVLCDINGKTTIDKYYPLHQYDCEQAIKDLAEEANVASQEKAACEAIGGITFRTDGNAMELKQYIRTFSEAHAGKKSYKTMDCHTS